MISRWIAARIALAALVSAAAGLAILAGGLLARSALVLKASFLVNLFERFGETAYPSAGASRSAGAPARAAAA